MKVESMCFICENDFQLLDVDENDDGFSMIYYHICDKCKTTKTKEEIDQILNDASAIMDE